MKTVILTLLVLVVVSQGEALKCKCKGTGCEQICSGSNKVCASIIYESGYQIKHIQGCMDANDCNRWKYPNYVTYANCCSWDLCNS